MKNFVNKAENVEKRENNNNNFKKGDKVKVGNMVLTIKQMGSVYDDEDFGEIYKSHVTFEENDFLYTNQLNEYIVETKNGKYKMIKI